MCDTMVAVPTAAAHQTAWFAKNSDREPGEAQFIERVPARPPLASKVACTYIQIPESTATLDVLISRPFWMWGAEMGVNERGVAMGNEAIFTRMPVSSVGLTGMDLVRLALERAVSAREAVDLLTRFISQYGQGGACGYRLKNFYYHNSFAIADRSEAWVLETAGEFWAALKVRSIATISNSLSIDREFDLIHPSAYTYARSKGWCRSASDFGFAGSFQNPRYSRLTGGPERSKATREILAARENALSLEDFVRALKSHAGRDPRKGAKMLMPCSHASWAPTRRSGQTTASLIAQLGPADVRAWATGTSSPCLSVFKPVTIDGDSRVPGSMPGLEYDDSLFWRHERLHRSALPRYERAIEAVEEMRSRFETRCLSGHPGDSEIDACWSEHREKALEWLDLVRGVRGRPRGGFLFRHYWNKQNRLDGIPDRV